MSRVPPMSRSDVPCPIFRVPPLTRAQHQRAREAKPVCPGPGVATACRWDTLRAPCGVFGHPSWQLMLLVSRRPIMRSPPLISASNQRNHGSRFASNGVLQHNGCTADQLCSKRVLRVLIRNGHSIRSSVFGKRSANLLVQRMLQWPNLHPERDILGIQGWNLATRDEH